MGANVLLGQHLLTRRADGAVELGVGVRLPNIPFVLFGFAGALFLFESEVVVSREQLLLLRRVRQQHQQLLKDLPEVLPKQLPATSVILGCRNETLGWKQSWINERTGKPKPRMYEGPSGIHSLHRGRSQPPGAPAHSPA